MLGRRVPEPDDPALVDEQDAVGNMLDDDGRTRTLLGRSVEACVVDRDRRTAAEVLRELEVVFVVETRGVGRDEHEPAESASGGGERDDHRRRHSELVENFVVRGVLRR